jgi:hypothetical protein
MMRASVDKRARDREPPRQVVADYEVDPREKHRISCPCPMCRCAWAGMSVGEWNSNGEPR